MISTRTACALLLALTGCRAASRHASTTPLSADDGPILEGVVSDANGKPVENATITLYGGFATRWKVAEATTGPDGRYRFAPVQAGSMTQDERGGWDYYVGIQLEHPELVSTDRCNWWDVQIPADKTGYLRRDFHMIPGGTLQARLLDHTGAPMPGVDLRLANPNRSAANYHRYATTDVEGHIALTGLAPGPYMVDINDPSCDFPFVGDFNMPEGGFVQVSLNAPECPQATAAAR